MERKRVDAVRGVCGIYLISDNDARKAYVGQAVDIGRRWAFHLWELNAGRHTNSKLQAAWNSHPEQIEFAVLEICPREQLKEREVFWIEALGTYQNGYNLTTGGENAEKPEGFGATLSKALKGRRGPMLGKKLSADHRKKISEKLKGNCNSGRGEKNHASKPVINLTTGERFSCAAEAGRSCGSKSVTPGVNIRKCCLGERPTALGYKWAFAPKAAEEEST